MLDPRKATTSTIRMCHSTTPPVTPIKAFANANPPRWWRWRWSPFASTRTACKVLSRAGPLSCVLRNIHNGKYIERVDKCCVPNKSRDELWDDFPMKLLDRNSILLICITMNCKSLLHECCLEGSLGTKGRNEHFLDFFALLFFY